MKQFLKQYKELGRNTILKAKCKIKNYQKTFLITLFVGIIIHLFALTNKLIHGDELAFLFDKGNSTILGRWFLDVTKYIFPNYSMPAFNGFIALILLSLSACLISEILEIKHDLNKILIGLILISFPTITCTMSYMFTVHSYMLALLMAILSVYFGKKNKKTFWCLSVVLLTLSLGIYQAYISITATLFLLILISKTLYGENIKNIVLEALKFFIILVISLILYAIINKIVINILNVELSSYQGVSTMGNYRLKGIWNGIVAAYKYVFSSFFEKNVMTPMSALRITYIVCFIFNIVSISVKICKNKENILNSVVVIFFVLLLPITMNIIYILNEKVQVYAVMLLGYSFIFISSILIIDNNQKPNFLERIIKLLLIIQIFFCTILANENYLQMHIAYENAYSFYESLISRITQTEGFDAETKIVIVGNYYSKELNNMEEFSELLPTNTFTSSFEVINAYSKLNFIKYYIGFEGDFIDENEARNVLKNNEEFINMPKYPYYGSIKKIEDLLVVKLSE